MVGGEYGEELKFGEWEGDLELRDLESVAVQGVSMSDGKYDTTR